MFNAARIGEVLVEQGAVTEELVDEALGKQEDAGLRLGEILIDMGACSQIDVCHALGAQLGYDVQATVDLDTVDLDLLTNLKMGWSRDNVVLPISGAGADDVWVAVADPLNTTTLDHLRFVLQREALPILVPADALAVAINGAFDRKIRMSGSLGEHLEDAESPATDDDVADIEDILEGQESNDEAPVIQFVNSLFVQAARDQVSDIHIEPGEHAMKVRFRQDGVLKEVTAPPKRFQSSIAARIKIMAGLNIAEKRIPQDGRIRIKIAGKDIDIRVATAPSSFGERITMRLLDASALLLDLKAIGMSEDVLREMQRLIQLPHGIILVTGPTGSGKTTTLYSALSAINTPDRNILTVEDPVEYQLEGISQMQVNAKINLTFAAGLRSYLRHDPDVVLVGEIRDKETADIAIQASLTGHLVFSTLHTNDSAGAFTRLTDMGVEPFLVASSLVAVLAQRLVRRICKECREPYVPSAGELEEIGLTPEDVANAQGHIYRPMGCTACNKGYKGRLGIYELMKVSEKVQRLAMKQADAGTIKREAAVGGMRSLRDDGALKVLSGHTSIEEVLRVTQEES